ncbi:MAG: tol-pal system YbgF family protein [Candidatus Aminicenantaceae bacterium]
MKKKLKKRIKTDEFVNLIKKLLELFTSYRRELLIGAVAIALLTLVFVSIKTIQGIQAHKQSDLLGQILILEEELKTDSSKLGELEQLGSKSKYGRLAYLKAATYNFEMGNADRALDTLQQIPASKKDLIYYQSRDLLGQIYFLQKKYDDALTIFEEMERDRPKAYAMDIVLYRKAQVLAARNDIDLAIAAYTRLQEEFPGSYFGSQAPAEILKLEQKK